MCWHLKPATDGVLIKNTVLGLQRVSEMGVRKSIRPYKTISEYYDKSFVRYDPPYFVQVNPDPAPTKNMAMYGYASSLK